MSRNSLYPWILVLVWGTAHASEPAWITSTGRERLYPDDRYLSAAMCAQPADRNQALPMARDAARSELSHSIRVRIQSEFLDYQAGNSTRYDTWSSSTSRLTGDLVLEGVAVQDWLDPKTGLAWAVAAVERTPLADRFRQQATTAIVEGERILSGLASRDETGQRLGAGEALTAFVRAYEDARLARIIRHHEADADLSARITAGRQKAEAALDRWDREAPTTDRGLAGRLADRLGKPLANTVRVADLTSRETAFSSPFGRLMARILSEELARRSWQVVDQGGVVMIEGALYGADQSLRIMLRARVIETGTILTAAEMTAPLSLTGGLGIAPQNLAQVLEDRQAIAAGEVASNGLRVEAWTGKGGQNPIFTEGETTRLSIRVNRSAWIRVLYHLASKNAEGRPVRVVLIDNHFVPADQANRLVDLPGTFEIAPPFGAEVIQVLASTVRHPPLRTAQGQGYTILVENLAEALARTRGMRQVADEQVLTSECHLSVTTLAAMPAQNREKQ